MLCSMQMTYRIDGGFKAWSEREMRERVRHGVRGGRERGESDRERRERTCVELLLAYTPSCKAFSSSSSSAGAFPALRTCPPYHNKHTHTHSVHM